MTLAAGTPYTPKVDDAFTTNVRWHEWAYIGHSGAVTTSYNPNIVRVISMKFLAAGHIHHFQVHWLDPVPYMYYTFSAMTSVDGVNGHIYVWFKLFCRPAVVNSFGTKCLNLTKNIILVFRPKVYMEPNQETNF